MRVRRNVTLQPTGQPVRILNAASDFLALVTMAFCPAMSVKSATALSMILRSATASPTPMFNVTFTSRGARMGFL